MDTGDPLAAPLLGPEHGLHDADHAGAPHTSLGQEGSHPHHVSWLSEQLRGGSGSAGAGASLLAESPGHGGMLGSAAAALPPGYHQPKLSTRTLARHQSMASTRAR